MATAALQVHPDPSDDLPVTPSVERWRAMTQAERDAFHDTAIAALEREKMRRLGGRPHLTFKGTLDELESRAEQAVLQVEEANRRAEEAAQQVEEANRRAEEASQRAQAAEARLAELLARLGQG